MYGRDIEILRFFSSAQHPLLREETPFGASELSDLEKQGFLSYSDKSVPGEGPREHPDTKKAYFITRKGLNEIELAKKMERVEKRSIRSYRATIISAVLAGATLIVTVLAWLLG